MQCEIVISQREDVSGRPSDACLGRRDRGTRQLGARASGTRAWQRLGPAHPLTAWLSGGGKQLLVREIGKGGASLTRTQVGNPRRQGAADFTERSSNSMTARCRHQNFVWSETRNAASAVGSGERKWEIWSELRKRRRGGLGRRSRREGYRREGGRGPGGSKTPGVGTDEEEVGGGYVSHKSAAEQG